MGAQRPEPASPSRSARRVPHGRGGRAPPALQHGGLRLQHPADGRVHPDDHRLRHGGHLRPLHAAPVPDGVPVALLPLPAAGPRRLRRRHLLAEVTAERGRSPGPWVRHRAGALPRGLERGSSTGSSGPVPTAWGLGVVRASSWGSPRPGLHSLGAAAGEWQPAVGELSKPILGAGGSFSAPAPGQDQALPPSLA